INRDSMFQCEARRLRSHGSCSCSGFPPMRACMVSYSMYDSDSRVRRYAETLVKRGYRVDAVALRREKQGTKNDFLNGVRVFRVQSRVKNEKSKFTYLAKLVLFFFRSLVFLTCEQLKE